MGINTVPQPLYCPDLTPCDFWLFPKLIGCLYETIEEMKEAVTKVIDTLTQEDFHGAFQKLIRIIRLTFLFSKKIYRNAMKSLFSLIKEITLDFVTFIHYINFSDSFFYVNKKERKKEQHELYYTERQTDTQTHTHTHIYIYIYIISSTNGFVEEIILTYFICVVARTCSHETPTVQQLASHHENYTS